MTPLKVGIVVFGVFFAVLAGWYLMYGQKPPPPPPQVTVAPGAVTQPPLVEDGPKHPLAPVAEEPVGKPLPALNASDADFGAALGGLIGLEALGKFIRPEELVRHVVVTIDNLPRKTYADRLSPIHPPPAPMAAAGKEGQWSIAPGNAARYAPYVSLAESIDPRRLVAIYARFYPLFQQAYVDLGFPKGYFNDRLVEVIDHLLAAPEVSGPIPLVVPHVLYEFADPQLEALSAGQKLLVRMGPENAARVKARLRLIRQEVIARVAKR